LKLRNFSSRSKLRFGARPAFTPTKTSTIKASSAGSLEYVNVSRDRGQKEGNFKADPSGASLANSRPIGTVVFVDRLRV